MTQLKKIKAICQTVFSERILPLWIVLAAVLVRVALFLTYQPWLCGDTSSYLELFLAISSKNWDSFCGGRTPVYPIFLVPTSLVGVPNPYITVFSQLLLGTLSALFVYGLTRRITGNRWLAFGVGLWCALYLKQAQSEMMLLSESVCTFLFTLLLYVWVCWEKKTTWWNWLLLGLLAALLVLTRPNNLFLLPVLGLRLFFVQRDKKSGWRWMRPALAFFAMALLPVLLWCGFLYNMTGRFTISNYTGIHLTNKTIDWIEYAPKKYAAQRDILRKYSRGRVSPDIPLDSRMWVALQELNQLEVYTAHKQGARLVEISGALLRMDQEMILAHPLLYLQAVGEAWNRFWHADPFAAISVQNTQDPRGACGGGSVVIRPGLQNMLVQAARPQDWITHILIWGFPYAILLFGAFYWRCAREGASYPIFAGALILCAAFSCALVEYGNGRFVLPYTPVLFCAWAVMGWNAVNWLRSRR